MHDTWKWQGAPQGTLKSYVLVVFKACYMFYNTKKGQGLNTEHL